MIVNSFYPCVLTRVCAQNASPLMLASMSNHSPGKPSRHNACLALISSTASHTFFFVIIVLSFDSPRMASSFGQLHICFPLFHFLHSYLVEYTKTPSSSHHHIPVIIIDNLHNLPSFPMCMVKGLCDSSSRVGHLSPNVVSIYYCYYLLSYLLTLKSSHA